MLVFDRHFLAISHRCQASLGTMVPHCLTVPDIKHKVSSVLNRSSEFASKHMFDGRLDTCWNSDQGSPQFILFDFGKNVITTDLKIMFQGGFAGVDGTVEVGSALESLVTVANLDITDTNDMQSYSLQLKNENQDMMQNGRYLRIAFPTSTDFYGRVTIYQLEVWGYDST